MTEGMTREFERILKRDLWLWWFEVKMKAVTARVFAVALVLCGVNCLPQGKSSLVQGVARRPSSAVAAGRGKGAEEELVWGFDEGEGGRGGVVARLRGGSSFWGSPQQQQQQPSGGGTGLFGQKAGGALFGQAQVCAQECPSPPLLAANLSRIAHWTSLRPRPALDGIMQRPEGLATYLVVKLLEIPVLPTIQRLPGCSRLLTFGP